MSRLIQILKIIFYIISSVFVLIALFALLIGYPKVILDFIKLLGWEQFNNKILTLISVFQFYVIVGYLFFLSLLFFLMARYFYSIWNLNVRFLRLILVSIKEIVQWYKLEYRWILLLSPMLFSFGLMVLAPLRYDEIWTYLNFTSKGPIASIAYYPSPNNHILHSLSTNLFHVLPFLKESFKLRLPVTLSFFMALVVMGYYAAKIFGLRVGIFMLAFFPLLDMSIQYSFESRGYALLYLLFLIAWIASFQLIAGKNSRKYVVLYVISSILGFYCMPSFLYAWLSLSVLHLIYKPYSFVQWIWIHFVILVSTLFLYIPVILVSGLKSLTSNPFVIPIDRTEVWNGLSRFWFQFLAHLSGINAYWLLVTLLLAIPIVIYGIKNERKISFLFAFLILPSVWLLIHSVLPFSRTFFYLGFIIVLIISIALDRILPLIKNKILVWGLCLIQSSILVTRWEAHYNPMDYNGYASDLASNISGNYDYILYSNLFDTFLLYQLKMGEFTSYNLKYNSARPVSADTLFSDFQIIDLAVDETQNKPVFISTNVFNVYKN
jgi:hypothetical protein